MPKSQPKRRHHPAVIHPRKVLLTNTIIRYYNQLKEKGCETLSLAQIGELIKRADGFDRLEELALSADLLTALGYSMSELLVIAFSYEAVVNIRSLRQIHNFFSCMDQGFVKPLHHTLMVLMTQPDRAPFHAFINHIRVLYNSNIDLTLEPSTAVAETMNAILNLLTLTKENGMNYFNALSSPAASHQPHPATNSPTSPPNAYPDSPSTTSFEDIPLLSIDPASEEMIYLNDTFIQSPIPASQSYASLFTRKNLYEECNESKELLDNSFNFI